MKQIKGIKLAICLVAVSLMVSPLTSNADVFDVLKAVGDSLQEGQPQQGQQKAPSSGDANALLTPKLEGEGPWTGPGGIVATCDNVQGLNSPKIEKFNVQIEDWSKETVSFLKSVIDNCGAKRLKTLNPVTDREKINAITRDVDVSKYNVESRYKDMQEILAYKRNEDAYKQKKKSACDQSPAFDLFKQQNAVVETNEYLASLRQGQEREKRISKESGVRNLARERAFGEAIVTHTEFRDAYFAKYKELGGKAPSADKVTRQLPNPCQ